jgi:hypothetical protein
MNQAERAVGCPKCGKPSHRTVSMPYVSSLDPNVRTAHERNEKSAHEPKVVSRHELDALDGRIEAGHRHHHGGHAHHRHARAPRRPNMLGHAH